MADVKIDIPGIGEIIADNAASEATLREILKALGGKQRGPQTGQNNPMGEASEETSKQVEKMGESSEKAGEEVDSFATKLNGFVGGAWNLFTSAIGATIGSVVGLGTELIAGGNRLSDFTQYLPIPGLTQFAGLLDGQVDLFRELSSTGATFGNNMFEITRIAGNAAIPQRDFAELLSNNAANLRLFGDTVGSGARQFAGMSKEMRQGGMGPSLMAMGFTTQELNENLISYNEMMHVTGRRQYMSNQQLIAGAQNYSLELDKLSKLTGKSREQLAAEIAQKNTDIRRQMAIAKYGEEYALRLQQAAEITPKFEAAILDMADGVENDPLTRQLMNSSVTFRNQVGRINEMTATEFANFSRTVADESRAFADSQGDAAVQAGIANNTAVGEMFLFAGEMQRARSSTEGAVDDEQAARDASTAAMATLSETINSIRGSIQVALIDSGIFQDMKTALTDLLPTLPEARQMFQDAADIFKTQIMPSINTFWEWLKGDGYTAMTDALGSTWNWLKEVAWPNIKETFETLSNLWEEHGPAIKQFFSDLFEDPKKVWDEVIWPKIKEGLEGFFGDFDWVAFGGTMLLALTRLNPFGALASTIIAGIVGFIGWDNIKQYFSATDLGTALTNAVSGLFNWITGLFDFDFGAMINSVIPDWAKRFLPDSWFAGPSSDPGGAPPPSPEEMSQAETESSSSPTPTPTSRTNDVATSNGEVSLAQLNTNTSRMIELLETQNRLLRQMDGNLYG